MAAILTFRGQSKNFLPIGRNEQLSPEYLDERCLRHGWRWTITMIIAYMPILVAGVIENLMVTLVVLLRSQMRTVTNIFIMNLAVAALFVTGFCVPSTLLANIFARKLFFYWFYRMIKVLLYCKMLFHDYSFVSSSSLDSWLVHV